MANYWRMTLIIDDEVIRRYHELEAEDPETDQTLVSDWLSDLVVDARSAHGHAQNYSGPDIGAIEEVRYGRVGRNFDGNANLVFVCATRIDNVDAATATFEANADGTGPDADGT